MRAPSPAVFASGIVGGVATDQHQAKTRLQCPVASRLREIRAVRSPRLPRTSRLGAGSPSAITNSGQSYACCRTADTGSYGSAAASPRARSLERPVKHAPAGGKSHQCKGANGQPCEQLVTYTWTPVYTIVSVKPARKATEGGTETAYLTCALGHTNPYVIDDKGDILG